MAVGAFQLIPTPPPLPLSSSIYLSQLRPARTMLFPLLLPPTLPCYAKTSHALLIVCTFPCIHLNIYLHGTLI